jgi:hypothetical protein
VQGTEIVDQKNPAPYSSDQTNMLTKETVQAPRWNYKNEEYGESDMVVGRRDATHRIYRDAN